jgi:hypothetical protein
MACKVDIAQEVYNIMDFVPELDIEEVGKGHMDYKAEEQ